MGRFSTVVGRFWAWQISSKNASVAVRRVSEMRLIRIVGACFFDMKRISPDYDFYRLSFDMGLKRANFLLFWI